MATLGFIGTGNMGGALAKAACHVLPSDQVFLANRTVSKAQILAEELECRVTDNEAAWPEQRPAGSKCCRYP